MLFQTGDSNIEQTFEKLSSTKDRLNELKDKPNEFYCLAPQSGAYFPHFLFFAKKHLFSTACYADLVSSKIQMETFPNFMFSDIRIVRIEFNVNNKELNCEFVEMEN